MNLLEIRSSTSNCNTNSKVSSHNYDLIDDLIEPNFGNIINKYINYCLYFLSIFFFILKTTYLIWKLCMKISLLQMSSK